MRKRFQTPWSSISDMMSALMMVFMFISVSYAFQISKQTKALEDQTEKVSEITKAYEDNHRRIYEELMTRFGPKLQDWKAEIDKETLTFRFNDPALLFEAGSAELTSTFSDILSEFWPAYVALAIKNSKDIREVKIEGHTSSEWASASLDESYFNNMELSQERTRATLEFCYSVTPLSARGWVRNLVTANGMSFSRPILDDSGNEARENSRRVEFTIIVDSSSTLDQIMREIND